ncbi:MAG: hypothetical protein JRN24_00695 [Nitrososphaerota archaeon]|nr:hypothetical protein [Nitrososphaerota archaeon]
MSLAALAEERFFTLDHVGVVRHFEGVDLQAAMPRVKSTIARHGGPIEDAVEEVRGLPVYTAIAPLRNGMTVWFKVTHFEGVGVVVDAKIFHATDQSAEADELLSRFVDELG